MGINRQSSYRFIVPAQKQLQHVNQELKQLLQGRSTLGGDVNFEGMIMGEFEATHEEAMRLTTWAQRLLARLDPFGVKVFGISAQPPGRLFLRTLPTKGCNEYLQIIQQLNEYLLQYELPLVGTKHAFRVPAVNECVGYSCFEYLDIFRQISIEKIISVSYVQLQRLSRQGVWEPMQNIFLHQPSSSFLQPDTREAIPA